LAYACGWTVKSQYLLFLLTKLFENQLIKTKAIAIFAE